MRKLSGKNTKKGENYYRSGCLFFLVLLLCSCDLLKDKRDSTVYYYSGYNLRDLYYIDEMDTLPAEEYTAICRIPIRDQTFWEQEFVYEDSSKSWELREVRIRKVQNDTLWGVESANRGYIFEDFRDPEQLLVWGADTIFTAIYFPLSQYTEHRVGKEVSHYDSTYSTIVHQQKMEDGYERKMLMKDILTNIRAKLKIQSLWGSIGAEYPYIVRYVGMRDIQIGDTLYKNAYRYSLRSSDGEVFWQYQRLTTYFSREYVLLQESMGWNDDGFVYRKLLREKPKSVPECKPLPLSLER